MAVRSRTWLVTVFCGKHCLYAENLRGSRNYLPRLFEVCGILIENLTSLKDYEVSIVRMDLGDDKHGDGESFYRVLTESEVKSIGTAWQKTGTV